jgi:hypothetical protein
MEGRADMNGMAPSATWLEEHVGQRRYWLWATSNMLGEGDDENVSANFRHRRTGTTIAVTGTYCPTVHLATAFK